MKTTKTNWGKETVESLKRATARYNLYTRLYQDEGEKLSFTGTENECIEWFLKNTNYSFTNALESGLARLEEVTASNYFITNTKDGESYERVFLNDEEARHWVINHLDLSKEWIIKK
jgi:hypothetical protein